MKKVLVTSLLLGVLGASQAFAAVTVDTTAAIADATTVFTAVLAVAVLIFGFKKAKSLLH